MDFVIGVYGAPDSSGAQAAYLFSKALLKKSHRISQIFFYEAGISHADSPSKFEELGISLGVCSTLRPTPHQEKIKSLSLTHYIHAILQADRHVIFR